MNERGAYLAHNARSNMNNAVGYNDLLHNHRKVVLGTDGMGSDMLEEFKFAVFRHRESQGPWWPGDFLACLDRGNRLLENYFGGSSEDSKRGRRPTSCTGTTIPPPPWKRAMWRATWPSA
jgi:hypothetical protein